MQQLQLMIGMLCVIAVTGCSSTNFAGTSRTTAPQAGATGNPATGGPSTTTNNTNTNTSTTTTGVPIPSTVSVPVATSMMYANTSTQLYSIDQPTGQPEVVGTFTVGGFPIQDPIYDLGIDSTGKLFAVSPTNLYAVNPKTAALQLILAHGVSNADGLTVLSNGTIVIAGNGVGIIPPNSALTMLVQPGQFQSSGDIIALPDGNLYWSVTGNGSDQLVTINPSTGAVSVAGSMGVSEVWGLGYANSILYGFRSNGDVVPLSTSTGEAGAPVQTDGEQWTGATTNPVLW